MVWASNSSATDGGVFSNIHESTACMCVLLDAYQGGLARAVFLAVYGKTLEVLAGRDVLSPALTLAVVHHALCCWSRGLCLRLSDGNVQVLLTGGLWCCDDRLCAFGVTAYLQHMLALWCDGCLLGSSHDEC